MILSDYTKKVQDEVDDHSATRKTVIDQQLQDTYQEIINLMLPFLVASTEEDITGTVNQRYVTPTNSYQIVEHVLWRPVDSDNYKELHEITKKDYYETFVNRDSSSPAYYYLENDNIYFDVAAIEAGTCKVNGYEVQRTLEGSQESIIPDRYESVLLLGSIGRFKAYEGLEDANEYQKMYHGPYFEQGKLGGRLKYMYDSLSTRQKKPRIKFYGN